MNSSVEKNECMHCSRPCEECPCCHNDQYCTYCGTCNICKPSDVEEARN